MNHVNALLLNGDPDARQSSEAWHLKKAIEMASKINWRVRVKKDVFTTKGKEQFKKMKSDYDARFQNETIVRIKAE